MTALKQDAFRPPHNVEAEQGLLGALLDNNGFFERYCSDLHPRHFYDAVHGDIFAVVSGLIQNGRAVDAVSLRQHFISDGGLAEIGGAEYLLTLAENAARLPVHVQEYAFIVRDLAMRRAALADLDAAKLHLLSDFKTPAADHLMGLERKVGAYASAGQADEDISLRDAGRSAIDKYKAGGRGLSTGLETVDAMIAGLFPEDLLVIAGRPSMGKTALLDNIAHACASAGRAVALWSGEMAAEQIAERALSRASYGQGDAFQYRAFRRREVPLQAAEAALEALPDSLIINRRGAITLDRLRAFLRRVRRQQRRLDLVAVDYLQLMRDEQRKHGETAEVTAITAGLKEIAKDFRVPVIALSQLSRDLEKRDDKRPKLADLRQSGSIEQDADIVLFVYREAYYLERDEPRRKPGEAQEEADLRYFRWCEQMEAAAGKVEIIAAKARHDSIGSKWLNVDLGFDLTTDIETTQERSRPARNPLGREDT